MDRHTIAGSSSSLRYFFGKTFRNRTSEHVEKHGCWVQVNKNTMNTVVYIQELTPNLNGKHAELVRLRLLPIGHLS